MCRTIPGQVRVLFFLARNARQLPLPKPPERTFFKAVTKNPSAATNKGKERAKPNANIGSRKHAVFYGPPFVRLPVAAEGRF
jgi:hypothetical protein